MSIFLSTAAYGYEAASGPPAQTPGFTYYTVTAGLDVNIPDWTIRIANTITASVGIVGWALFCANAQYASPSHSAFYPGLISSPVNNTRTTNGLYPSYGMPGWIKGFSSSSYFTDSFTITGATAPNNAPWSANATFYGGNFSTTYIGYIVRDYTRYKTPTDATAGSWNTWGCQPYPNTCAAYSWSFAATDIAKWNQCSDNSAVTSSNSGSACARTFVYSGAGGSPGKLTIKNYYTASCGTY